MSGWQPVPGSEATAADIAAFMREMWRQTGQPPKYMIVPGRAYRVRVRRRGRTCLRQRLDVHPALLRALHDAREWWDGEGRQATA